jgi:hypothetical protein
MIDNELDQLSRALIAATDRLNSQDFQDRQSKYVRDELALKELAESLEADESAVERAQAALTRHIQANYLEGSHLTVEEPQQSDDALFEDDEPRTEYIATSGYKPHDPQFHVEPIPNDEDEYQSARAAGAYTEN